MHFSDMPRVFKDQPLWGAEEGGYSFIISFERGLGYRASVKPIGAVPFDGKINFIGEHYRRFGAAMWACEQWLKEQRNVLHNRTGT